MNAGDAAEPDDIWLRPVTNETHLKGKMVHHGALKKWITPPDDPLKPWKLEFSGRLRSMITGISADAINKVESQKAKLIATKKKIPSALKYCGILHIPVESVRSIPEFNGDVIYDPTNDPAHANIVIKDKDVSDILTVTEVLIRNLVFLESSLVAANATFSARA